MNIQDNDISLVSGALRSGDSLTDASAKTPGRSGSATEEPTALAEQSVPSRDAVQQLLNQAEEQLGQQGVSLTFKLKDGTDQYQVEVRDKGSDRVIRKIPSDEVVNLSRSIKAMTGALFDKGI